MKDSPLLRITLGLLVSGLALAANVNASTIPHASMTLDSEPSGLVRWYDELRSQRLVRAEPVALNDPPQAAVPAPRNFGLPFVLEHAALDRTNFRWSADEDVDPREHFKRQRPHFDEHVVDFRHDRVDAYDMKGCDPRGGVGPPAPVPLPGTLLLLASAVALVLPRMRRHGSGLTS